MSTTKKKRKFCPKQNCRHVINNGRKIGRCADCGRKWVTLVSTRTGWLSRVVTEVPLDLWEAVPEQDKTDFVKRLKDRLTAVVANLPEKVPA